MDKKRNAGFTLIQMVITVALLSVMTTVLVSRMDTNDAKITMLLTRMNEIASGLAATKADMSCYPRRLDGLLKPTTDTVCGTVSGALWKGAYIGSGTGYDDATGNITMDDIVPGAQVTFSQKTFNNSAGVAQISYLLTTLGLPVDIAKKALEVCGETDESRCGLDADGQIFITVSSGPAPVALTYGSNGVFTP